MGEGAESKENDKVIINFPTKDKWREASKIKYISESLKALAEVLANLNVNKVAIPP